MFVVAIKFGKSFLKEGSPEAIIRAHVSEMRFEGAIRIGLEREVVIDYYSVRHS